MSTFDRYLLREVAVPFCVGLGLFFVVVVFGELIKISDAVTGLGIGAADFATALLYSLPPLLGLLLPMSTLFAMLLAVGRLAADRELIAAFSAGLDPFALLRVPLLVGTVLAAISTCLLLLGEPWGIQGLQNLMARSAQASIASGVRVGQFNEWVDDVVFFAKGEEQNGVLVDVMLADRRDREHPIVVSARRGRVIVGAHAHDIVFDLEEGTILSYSADGASQRLIEFERGQYRLDVGALVEGKLFNVTRAQGMYPWQLWEKSETDPRPRRRALYTVTLHRKVALPLATIIFALLAVPLACRATSGARARGFLYSAGIVAAYYYIGRAAELSARAGGMPAALAAWLPNLCGVVALVILLWRFRFWAARR